MTEVSPQSCDLACILFFTCRLEQKVASIQLRILKRTWSLKYNSAIPRELLFNSNKAQPMYYKSHDTLIFALATLAVELILPDYNIQSPCKDRREVCHRESFKCAPARRMLAQTKGKSQGLALKRSALFVIYFTNSKFWVSSVTPWSFMQYRSKCKRPSTRSES